MNKLADAIPASGPPASPSLSRLADLLRAHAPVDGSVEQCVPGVHAIRASRPNADLVHGVQGSSVCIVAQGAKTVLLGGEAYTYDAARMLVFSVDLPVAAQVLQATPARPYLCFRLDLDAQRIAALTLKVYPDGPPREREGRALYLAQAGDAIVDAAARLMALMDDPPEAALLAPLVTDELLIRLLRSPIGGRLAQIGQADSGTHRIGRAVAWLRDHYDQPVSIDDLAGMVHMSASTLHQHFKSVTSMSPLQYQKILRLHEARRLMSTGMGASAAGGRVGYVSASQFSREYARLFGNAPSRDRPRQQNAV
ncbi:AraC family transcriptional regulator [Herbaspirillum sp. SJZ107]|uniref:AraC family transcriptional regulator n=1 Tax=Herbaspirillum sp. SJZ107 TaxID=2572881 RepID=UPI00115436B1|nr:AraC family transcriptional regulator [Herbaspirillum sp. SJZ107]